MRRTKQIEEIRERRAEFNSAKRWTDVAVELTRIREQFSKPLHIPAAIDFGTDVGNALAKAAGAINAAGYAMENSFGRAIDKASQELSRAN